MGNSGEWARSNIQYPTSNIRVNLGDLWKNPCDGSAFICAICGFSDSPSLPFPAAADMLAER